MLCAIAIGLINYFENILRPLPSIMIDRFFESHASCRISCTLQVIYPTKIFLIKINKLKYKFEELRHNMIF